MTSPSAVRSENATRTIRPELASKPPAKLDQELRSGFVGMSKALRGVPVRFRAAIYDFTRAEKRGKPFGIYPEYALAVIRSGAPLADAEGPLNELRGWVRSHFSRVTCLATALEGLGKEQGEANVAALRLMRNTESPCPSAIDDCIRELNEMIAAAETVRDDLYARRYTEKAK